MTNTDRRRRVAIALYIALAVALLALPSIYVAVTR